MKVKRDTLTQLLVYFFFFNFPAQGEISLEKSCKIAAVRMSSLAGLGIPASRAEASTQPGVCFKNGILVCTTLVEMTCCLTRSGYRPARPMPPEGSVETEARADCRRAAAGT